MAKTTTELIDEAEQILSLIYQEDIFGIDSKENVVRKEDVPLVQQFIKDLDAFTLHLSKDSVAYERIEENSWLLNGRRVSSQRIQKVIDILKEL